MANPHASQTRAPFPDGRGKGRVNRTREAASAPAEESPIESTPLQGFTWAHLGDMRIASLALDALMRQCESPAPARGAARNVKGVIEFLS